MLRFTSHGSLFFKRLPMVICNYELRKFVALPADCEAIWIEFSTRPAKHRFNVRLGNDTEWYASKQFSRPCFVDGHRVNLCTDTNTYLKRKFGFSTFYATVWY